MEADMYVTDRGQDDTRCPGDPGVVSDTRLTRDWSSGGEAPAHLRSLRIRSRPTTVRSPPARPRGPLWSSAIIIHPLAPELIHFHQNISIQYLMTNIAGSRLILNIHTIFFIVISKRCSWFVVLYNK